MGSAGRLGSIEPDPVNCPHETHEPVRFCHFLSPAFSFFCHTNPTSYPSFPLPRFDPVRLERSDAFCT